MNWFTDNVIQKMENRLKLYKVEVPNTPEGYQMTHRDLIAFIVACFSEEEARNFNPLQNKYPYEWVQPDQRQYLTVRKIGYAESDIEHGEILMIDEISDF